MQNINFSEGKIWFSKKKKNLPYIPMKKLISEDVWYIVHCLFWAICDAGAEIDAFLASCVQWTGRIVWGRIEFPWQSNRCSDSSSIVHETQAESPLWMKIWTDRSKSIKISQK